MQFYLPFTTSRTIHLFPHPYDFLPQRADLFRSRFAAAGLRHFQLRAFPWRISFPRRVRECGIRGRHVPDHRQGSPHLSVRGPVAQSVLHPMRGFGAARPSAAQIPHLQTRTRPPDDGAAHKQALEEFAPPSILVDSAYRVLHLSESAGRFLQLPGGPPTPSVHELIRPELRPGLLSALSKAFERQLLSLTTPVLVKFNGTEAQVQLQVQPISRQIAKPSALILFIEASAGDVRSADLRSFSPAELRTDNATQALAEELDSTKTLLHTSRQEYETVIEELRAANEEMQSVSEEYRSTAEELETSREELQSVNEELQATNQELSLKVETISRAHNTCKTSSLLPTSVRCFSTAICASGALPRKSPIFLTLRPSMWPADLELYPQARRLSKPRRRRTQGFSRSCTARERGAERCGPLYLLRIRPYRTIEDRIEAWL